MTCEQTRELFPGLLYGEIDAALRAQVDKHLVDCPACRGELAACRRVITALDQAPVPHVQVDMGRLYRDAALADDRRGRRWRRLALASMAAAAALFLFVVLRLEVHVDSEQLVVRWAAPAPAPVPAPAPPAPAPAIRQPEPDTRLASELHVLKEIVHALAAEISRRDGEQRDALLALEERIDQALRAAGRRLTTAEGNLTALYTAHFGTRGKGD